MSDENVVKLPERPPDDDRPIRVAIWSSKTCKHLRTTIDGDARLFVCNDCKVPLDPIQWLVDWAHRDRQRDTRLERIQAIEKALTVHAVGGRAVTLCGAGSDSRKLQVTAPRALTVTVSNVAWKVDCKRCRAILGKRATEWSRGQSMTITMDELRGLEVDQTLTPGPAE